MGHTIERIETFRVDGGWRTHGFVKVTADDGGTGWSECSQAHDGPGVMRAIAEIAPSLMGKSPTSREVNVALLMAPRRSHLAHQAVGAIRNALLDLRARALGVSVRDMLGGAVRDRVRVYWTHCGTYRVSNADQMGEAPIRTLEDITMLGKQVVERGYSALKTNVLLLQGGARRYSPGVYAEGFPERLAERQVVRGLREQLAALRAGTGPDVEIMLDLSSGYRNAAYVTLAKAIEEFDLAWLEIEIDDPRSLRSIRDRTTIPIVTGERFTREQYRPFLEAEATDLMITDVLFNGLTEALAIAALVDAFDLNIAPHNCYGPLASVIAGTFCALAPNFRIMEMDVDGVPWNADFVTTPPRVERGYLTLPQGPGWGTDVNEEAIRAHLRR